MATTKRKQMSSASPKRTPRAAKSPTATKTPRTKRAAGESAEAPAARKKKAKTVRARTGDQLAVYRSKRDFGKTPEPLGTSPSRWKKNNNPFFVIQKHAASRLHYDFRLEVDGVLKSWAVPKGPSMDPADKRLAVETEDHPMDYADFEGVIPEDEYGGGTVIVWDAGPYRNLKQVGGKDVSLSGSYRRGQIEVWLEGKKIRGGFALIHSRMGENEKNWLLIKMKDKAADPDDDPVGRRTESVISGRTLEDVARSPKKVWSSK